jgi:hypothetical protein
MSTSTESPIAPNLPAASSAPAPGSLLEGIDVPPAAAPAAPRGPRPFVPEVLKSNAAVRWTRRHRRTAITLLALLLVGAGVGLYMHFRFKAPPDYATAPIDDLLDYTLITDDFNKLPLEQRMELLRDLIKRFANSSGDESAMMAEWAALIRGDLRDQMMKNASKLAIDLWDKFAADYESVPEPDRGGWMDKTVVDFLKTMESFNPAGPRDVPDEKRLEEARAQAKRDAGAVRSGQLSSGQLGQMADFMRNGMGKFAAPQTQTRAAQLMRDMTRHLRGQDIVTGKPK